MTSGRADSYATAVDFLHVIAPIVRKEHDAPFASPHPEAMVRASMRYVAQRCDNSDFLGDLAVEQYGLSQSLRTLDALHLSVIKRLGPQQLRSVSCAAQTLIAILETLGCWVWNLECLYVVLCFGLFCWTGSSLFTTL